ncbi:MAG TPA: hypothetical protein ENH29_10060 [Bacteroidetes bacterium]|nr:hypothetical protein [Bacteroidota bacterium]
MNTAFYARMNNSNRGRIYALILIVFFLLLYTYASSAHEQVSNKEKTFAFIPGDGLKIDIDLGDVKIVTWQQNKIHVRMRKWVSAGSEKQLVQKMQNLQVEFVSGNHRLEIRQLNRNAKNFLSSILKKTGLKRKPSSRIDLSLQVPRKVALVIILANGNISISALHGNLEIAQKEGELNLDSLYADKIDLRLGNVHSRIENLQGYSSSMVNMGISAGKGILIIEKSNIGKLVTRLKEAEGYFIGNRTSGFDVQSKTGDIFVRPVGFKNCQFRIESEHGDIHFFMPEALPCSISMETGLGRIRTPYSWVIRKRGSTHYFRLKKTNPAGGKIDIVTDFGDIQIEKIWQGEPP